MTRGGGHGPRAKRPKIGIRRDDEHDISTMFGRAQAQDKEAVPLQQPEQLEAVPPAEDEAPPIAAAAEAAIEETAPPAAAVVEAALVEEAPPALTPHSYS